MGRACLQINLLYYTTTVYATIKQEGGDTQLGAFKKREIMLQMEHFWTEE
jgi:hypothetical protein